MDPNPIQLIFLIRKRKNLNPGMFAGKTSCEDEGKDWVDASLSQETPKIASKLPEARRVTE